MPRYKILNGEKVQFTAEEEKEFGNLIIDLSIEFPRALDDKRKEYLKKILNHKERDSNDSNE